MIKCKVYGIDLNLRFLFKNQIGVVQKEKEKEKVILIKIIIYHFLKQNLIPKQRYNKIKNQHYRIYN